MNGPVFQDNKDADDVADRAAETVYCRDCLHCVKTWEDGGSRTPDVWRCLVAVGPANLVTGEQYKGFCEIERKYETKCGPFGTRFRHGAIYGKDEEAAEAATRG